MRYSLIAATALASQAIAKPVLQPANTVKSTGIQERELEKRNLGPFCYLGCGVWCTGALIAYEICLGLCFGACTAGATDAGDLEGVSIFNGTVIAEITANGEGEGLFNVVDGQLITNDGTNIIDLGAKVKSVTAQASTPK